MVNVILHIGMHKTGSSAIQQALNGFASEDFAYLDLGDANHSIPIYTAFSRNFKKYHIWRNRGVSDARIEEMRSEFEGLLRKRLSQPVAPNLIISGEDISVLRPKEVERLADLFAECNASVRVIGYFRNPVSFISSNFQENIKSGFGLTTGIPLPQYQFRFQKFFRIFGRKNVDLRDYDQLRHTHKDVLEDFCAAVGISAQSRVKRKANTSMPLLAVKALSVIDEAKVLTLGDEDLFMARRGLIERLRRLFEEPFRLPDDIVRDTLNGRDVAWLEEKCRVAFDVPGLDRENGPKGGVKERLTAFMGDFPPAATQMLAEELRREGIPTAAYSDPLEVLTRLYYLEVRKAGSLKSKANQLFFG